MDLNGDGRRDIITGSWPGELYLFAGDESGAFADKVRIKRAGDDDVKAGRASAVFACDWDRDGDLDLLIGDIKGWITLFRATGKGGYSSGEQLAVRGTPIKVPGGDAAPCVADWDEPGRLRKVALGVRRRAGSVAWGSRWAARAAATGGGPARSW